jgi:hypothetical protein
MNDAIRYAEQKPQIESIFIDLIRELEKDSYTLVIMLTIQFKRKMSKANGYRLRFGFDGHNKIAEG